MKTLLFVGVLWIGCVPSMSSSSHVPSFDEQAASYDHPPADERVKPSGSGWHCSYHPAGVDEHVIGKPKQQEFFGACHRTEELCRASLPAASQKLLSSGGDRDAPGAGYSALWSCEPTIATFCFTYEKGDLEGQGVGPKAKPRTLVNVKRHFECYRDQGQAEKQPVTGCAGARHDVMIDQVRNYPHGTKGDRNPNEWNHISTCAKWD